MEYFASEDIFLADCLKSFNAYLHLTFGANLGGCVSMCK